MIRIVLLGAIIIIAVWVALAQCGTPNPDDPAQRMCQQWTEYGSQPDADHGLAWKNIEQYC